MLLIWLTAGVLCCMFQITSAGQCCCGLQCKVNCHFEILSNQCPPPPPCPQPQLSSSCPPPTPCPSTPPCEPCPVCPEPPPPLPCPECPPSSLERRIETGTKTRIGSQPGSEKLIVSGTETPGKAIRRTQIGPGAETGAEGRTGIVCVVDCCNGSINKNRCIVKGRKKFLKRSHSRTGTHKRTRRVRRGFENQEAVEDVDPTCNSETLRKIMISNISSSAEESKSVIQKNVEAELKQKFNVICSDSEFSYVAHVSAYCQIYVNGIHCYAFSFY